jgi:hypothetical protein
MQPAIDGARPQREWVRAAHFHRDFFSDASFSSTILALPLAWVLSQALRSDFLPWEKSVLAAGFTLPLLSTGGLHLGLPLGPAVLLAVLAVVLRRVRGLQSRNPAEASAALSRSTRDKTWALWSGRPPLPGGMAVSCQDGSSINKL